MAIWAVAQVAPLRPRHHPSVPVDTELELEELSTRSTTPTLVNSAELEWGEFSDLSVAALGVAPTAYCPECSSVEVVEAATAAANLSNSTAMHVLYQVDGGSNAHLLSNAGADALCRLSPAQGMIGGIAGRLEEAAGYKWAQARDKILVANGWRPAEVVPERWLLNAPPGKCRLLIVVDDLFFSEEKALKQTASKQLCAILFEVYGDVRYEIEPTSFKGYSIRRDRPACLIQLTFPQKINEAMRSHLPELINGGDVKLPAGKALQKLAEGIVLATPRPGKLAAAQMRTQQLIGSLKFIEQLHPRIALILHRLWCVMSNPPPEAYDIARAALASVTVSALWASPTAVLVSLGANASRAP